MADLTPSRTRILIVTAVLLMAGGFFMATQMQRAYRTERAEAHMTDWPRASRLAAGDMIQRYGPTDRLSADAMTWFGRAPWKRIVAHADPRQGPLEQVVGYKLPPEKTEPLLAFGRGVVPDSADSELSARHDREQLNFLALNLADDIVRGAKNPKEARAFYDQTVSLAASGKSSGYTAGLLFERYDPSTDILVKDMRY